VDRHADLDGPSALQSASVPACSRPVDESEPDTEPGSDIEPESEVELEPEPPEPPSPTQNEEKP
jgi:hypothetical protein